MLVNQELTPSPNGKDESKRVRAGLYLRASTTKKTETAGGEEYRQRPEIQEERLRALCHQRGWEVVAIYTDRASGRKESRPEFQRLMADARRGLFDVVVVAAFDRFARSTKHLVTALDEFRSLNIQFVSLREAIDTSTPLGKAMFTVIGAMAELESSLISERTAAAMSYTRHHGTRTGKPVGRPRIIFDRERAEVMRRAGMSYRQIARDLGVSPPKLHAALKQYRATCSQKATTGETDSALAQKAGPEVSQ